MTSRISIVEAPQSVDLTAWIALIVSLVTLGWMIWSEYTGYRRRQADEYWYREIFSPNCIEPLIEFLNDHIASLQKMDVSKVKVDETRRFCSNFSDRKEDLLGRIWISDLFSSTYYDFACAQLDEIEDAMVTCFGGWVVRPGSAVNDDIQMLRRDSVEKMSCVLASAADINLNAFIRKQRKLAKRDGWIVKIRKLIGGGKDA